MTILRTINLKYTLTLYTIWLTLLFLQRDESKAADFLGRLLKVLVKLEKFTDAIPTALKRIQLLGENENQDSLKETYRLLCTSLLGHKDSKKEKELVRQLFLGLHV